MALKKPNTPANTGSSGEWGICFVKMGLYYAQAVFRFPPKCGADLTGSQILLWWLNLSKTLPVMQNIRPNFATHKSGAAHQENSWSS